MEYRHMSKTEITPEEFHFLLEWLGGDREMGALKHETIKHGLNMFFRNRHCEEPEILADETMNRVAKKAQHLMATFQGEPAKYFYGVAHRVFQEYLRQPHLEASAYHLHLIQSRPPSDREQRHECLDECLDKFSERDKEIMLEYYQGDGKERILTRQALAEKLGTTLSDLRVKVLRLRKSLERCITECLEKFSNQNVIDSQISSYQHEGIK
jgi:DNA-directed RNA polymerase specialized sigma24 family protein